MFKRLFQSQLRINMVSGMAAAIGNTAILTIGYPLYLHLLGYEQYGVWLVLTTVLTFTQLGNLGIDSAVMKLVAEEYGRGDILGIQRYITTACVLLCVSGTVVLTVILALRRQIIALFALSGENAQVALWLLPYIGILSICVLIGQIFVGVLSGLGRMDLVNYRGLLARATNLCVSGGLLYLGCGIRSLLIGRTVAELTTHLAVFLCIRRMIHIRILQIPRLDILRCKRLLRFGGAILGSSLLNMLFGPMNKVILSRYLGVASIPIYEIAFRGGMQIRGLLIAGHRPMIPEISRLSAEMSVQAKTRILRLYRRSLQLIVLLGTPAYIALALLAPVFLRLWLGDKFIDTLPGTFRIMLIGTFMSVLSNPAYNALVGTGHVHHTLMARIIQLITNIMAILCVIAAFRVSVTAVAWSSSIGMAAAAIYLILRKRYVLSDAATSLSV
ncbi:MAG: oligosaccharide flippase family protein [Planctomycetes bacterium]|nr:oligosaccharide flippase family protein [Planctomycetota bacterium]